jgi:2-keto-4-pentenoate hydratase/2-oxohepta-3-ene-1,7-dioic acid hydratase in catechol pathway
MPPEPICPGLWGVLATPLQDGTLDVDDETVSTVKNGAELSTNTLTHMAFGPSALVSFHSKVMPLFPVDIISTGTPGAVVLDDGDIVECRIPGIGTLINHVRRDG